MNPKSLTLYTPRNKFHRLRSVGGTMPPNKDIGPMSGTENHAFEADDGPSPDNSTTVPEDEHNSSRSPTNIQSRKTKGNVSNVTILGNSAELLLSAAENLRCCADCLDAANETQTLVLQARLYNCRKLTQAVLLITEVIERLKKSLSVVQATKSEKVFTPVLVNTLTKESSQVERISQNLSADKKDSTRLDQDLQEIRTSILRCVEAFEPIRQAVFRPDRRGNHDCDRVGNQTREYLRSLDIDWRGLCQAKEALPIETKLPNLAVNPENKTFKRRSSTESLFQTGTKRYWPV